MDKGKVVVRLMAGGNYKTEEKLIRFNSVVICRSDDTYGQRPSCYDVLCFVSLLSSLPVRPCCGPEKGFFFHRGLIHCRRSGHQGQVSLLQNTRTGFGAHPASLSSAGVSSLGDKVATKLTADFHLVSITQENTTFCVVIPLRQLINICFLIGVNTTL
jgi:hypothetical protein